MGDAEKPLDVGFLVEAMVFYGHVNVVANRAALGQLVRAFEPELLLEFLKPRVPRAEIRAELYGSRDRKFRYTISDAPSDCRGDRETTPL